MHLHPVHWYRSRDRYLKLREPFIVLALDWVFDNQLISGLWISSKRRLVAWWFSFEPRIYTHTHTYARVHALRHAWSCVISRSHQNPISNKRKSRRSFFTKSIFNNLIVKDNHYSRNSPFCFLETKLCFRETFFFWDFHAKIFKIVGNV